VVALGCEADGVLPAAGAAPNVKGAGNAGVLAVLGAGVEAAGAGVLCAPNVKAGAAGVLPNAKVEVGAEAEAGAAVDPEVLG
jgi:hypothetical protein